MNLKDRYLIYQTKRGKSEAFAEIYDKYLNKIYRFIFFRVSSIERTEDLTSQVFLKTLEYINSGKRINHLQAFLYQIAQNLVIDFYRKKGREISLENEKIKESITVDFSIDVDSQKDAFEKIDKDLKMGKIEKALRMIRDEYREIIILYYLEEMSVGEIARILGKKKGNVRVLIHRALKVLRSVIIVSETK